MKNKVVADIRQRISSMANSLFSSINQNKVNAIASILEQDNKQLQQMLSLYLVNANNIPKSSANKNKQIILTSNSSRRRDILSEVLGKEIIPPRPTDVIELVAEDVNIATKVEMIALQKILAYINTYSDQLSDQEIVLSSDTFLVNEQNQVLGKIGGDLDHDTKTSPLDKLKKNFGTTLRAYSGVILLDIENKSFNIKHAISKVKFRSLSYNLSKEDISILNRLVKDKQYSYLSGLLKQESITVNDIVEAYFNEGKHEGKAGGFGIQDRELFLCVESLMGDPFNIVGLPTQTLIPMLKNLNIEIEPNDISGSFWPTEEEQSKLVINEGNK